MKKKTLTKLFAALQMAFISGVLALTLSGSKVASAAVSNGNASVKAEKSNDAKVFLLGASEVV